jgi:hypothetical protein
MEPDMAKKLTAEAEERRTPVHPVEPDAAGSAPEPTTVPAGDPEEPVKYVTDDIGPDGTPLIAGKPQGLVAPSPHINGETGSDMPEGHVYTETEQAAPDADPIVVDTEADARLTEIKEGRPAKVVEIDPTKAADRQ